MEIAKKKADNKRENKKIQMTDRLLMTVGLCIVALSWLPVFLLGERAAVPYHDQLDGELIAYIYQAKYLFSGQNVILEFLGGAAKTALCPPAPLAVLLFLFLKPFSALTILQMVGQVTAFSGMFFLTGRITKHKLIALVTALFYTFLPFLPVYGLSQYGMPLLLLCIWNLYREKGKKQAKERTGHAVGSILYVFLYAAMSSLVLCGFAWLGLWAAALLILIVRRRLGEHLWFLAGFLTLLGVYAAENLPLFGQMLGIGQAEISHKSEYAIAGGPFWGTFWNYWQNNDTHSADHHLWIAVLAVFLLMIILFSYQRQSASVRKTARAAAVNLAAITVLCLAAALWTCSMGAALRGQMGALGAFQFSRILWLAPMLWLLEFAFCLELLWHLSGRLRFAAYGVSFVLLGTAALVSLKHALVKPCVMQLIKQDYDVMSYEDYLAVGVMEQVEGFLEETEGRQKEDYRVASLGIDPAAALYHGFYCVDGYSNNYDVDYKHSFRRVIAPELDKSEYLRTYYDDWGNRCYLFSAECPGYYTVEKGGFFYQNLEIDTEELKKLGCDYVLSAAWIADAEEKNLLLLNEEGFETPDSYYRVFVYKIVNGTEQ